jgi:hypothetical protein
MMMLMNDDENDEDGTGINQMNLVDHVETEVVVKKNNWMD